jgi:hypothetical protein
MGEGLSATEVGEEISEHAEFPLRGVRIGLVAVGAALLLFAAVQILQLPGPPT